jgi:hypothetical protein
MFGVMHLSVDVLTCRFALGVWNQISDRDAAALKRVGAIVRFAGALTGGGNAFDAVDFVPYDPVSCSFAFRI